eukprot:298912_1
MWNWFGSTSSSSSSNNTFASNCLTAGTWIKRPISVYGRISFTYHHAIVIYGNIIIEFTNNNKYSTCQINFETQRWSVVAKPRDESHAKRIIQRAMSKYGVEKQYNTFFNNCEHFVNECYFGTKHSKQIQTAIYSNIMGAAAAMTGGFAKAVYLCSSVPPAISIDVNNWITLLTKDVQRMQNRKQGMAGFTVFNVFGNSVLWCWYHNKSTPFTRWIIADKFIMILDCTKKELLQSTLLYGTTFFAIGFIGCHWLFPAMKNIGLITNGARKYDYDKVVNVLAEIRVFDRLQSANSGESDFRQDLICQVEKIIFE